MPRELGEATPVLARSSGRDGALDAALARLVPDRVVAELRPDTPDAYVTAVRRLPPVAATFAPVPAGLDARLRDALEARGIAGFYSHQAEAVEHALAGRHVVVVTPTASGKTLCYNAPVLSAILKDPSSRALYLFPTKALAQDQLAELHGLAETLAAREQQDIGVFTYDGDTPQDARRAVRTRAHVVLTNADMLHAGILPHHPRWAKLFENLRYIVIDELHAYRGVFGSHLCNVLRRLDRICRHYGSSPVFICSSATIANPRDLAERLTERPFELVDRSGAPRGEKFFVFVNPPVVNRQLGIRRSYLNETRRVAAEFLKRNLQLIVFAQSRLATEILTTYLKDDFEGSPGTPERVRGYRGGYLPNRRREVERGLREGVVRAVVSTNALELGIDIGALDVAVLAGYPGTIAATWQRAGRAGRRTSQSAAVMVASSAPLDQFMVRNPSYFFDASPERALIDPDNLHILVDHVKCAAFELPFTNHEAFGRHDVQQVLAILAEQGLVHGSPGENQVHEGGSVQGLPEGEGAGPSPRDDECSVTASGGGAPREVDDDGGAPRAVRKWTWTSESYPADAVSLRSVTSDNFVVVDETHEPRVIGETDFNSGPPTLHPKAIYMVEGRLFQVERLDFDGRKAFVRQIDCDYYTDAITYSRVTILDTFASIDGTEPPHGLPEGEGDGPSRRDDECSVTASDSLEPLRGAEAPSNRAGGGVPGAVKDAGAPREVSDAASPRAHGSARGSSEHEGASEASGGGAPRAHGEVHVVSRVVGFKKIKFYTNENVGSGELDLPEQQMHTTAYWITIPPSIMGALPFAADDRRDGVLGLAFALREVAQLLLMCDRRDIGLSIDTGEPAEDSAVAAADASPRVFVYDNYPGGIGFSEPLYRMHAELVAATRRLIADCPCEQGCPGCVGPASGTGPMAKVAARRILDLLIAS